MAGVGSSSINRDQGARPLIVHWLNDRGPLPGKTCRTSVRQILEKEGYPSDKIYKVAGKANTDPLCVDGPAMAPSRRVTITPRREAPPPDLKQLGRATGEWRLFGSLGRLTEVWRKRFARLTSEYDRTHSDSKRRQDRNERRDRKTLWQSRSAKSGARRRHPVP